MDPSYFESPSEDPITFLIHLANAYLSAQSLRDTSDTGPVDEPRTGRDVLQLVLGSRLNCFRFLDCYIMHGFRPRHDVFPLRNRHARNGQQTGFVRFLELVYEEPNFVRDLSRPFAIFSWFI
jgi:hypothetical protein